MGAMQKLSIQWSDIMLGKQEGCSKFKQPWIYNFIISLTLIYVSFQKW